MNVSINGRIKRTRECRATKGGMGIRVCYEPIRASQMVIVAKNPPANAGNIREAGSIRGLGRCPGGGHGSPLHSSCLENPMDRGAWRAPVHWVAELGTTGSTYLTCTNKPVSIQFRKARGQFEDAT